MYRALLRPNRTCSFAHAIEVARRLGKTIPREFAESCLRDNVVGGWFALAKDNANYLGRALTTDELGQIYRLLLANPDRINPLPNAIEVAKRLGKTVPREYAERVLQNNVVGGWLPFAESAAKFLGRYLTSEERQTIALAEERRKRQT
ncbi:MAG: hypothetical protein WC641_07955 [Patescibacteria group bacterium]